MNGQMKNYNEYIKGDYTPIDSNKFSYFVNMRALRDYAKAKNVPINALSKTEKEQFLIKNIGI